MPGNVITKKPSLPPLPLPPEIMPEIEGSAGAEPSAPKSAGSPIQEETHVPKNWFLGKNYLLLVAIDNYEEEATGCKPLKNPVRDANRFREVLMKRFGYRTENRTNGDRLEGKRIYDGTPYDRCLVLNDKYIKCLYNDYAKKDAIKKAVETMVKQMTREDQLTIYFSGHGIGGDEMMLIPYDYIEDDPDTAMALKDLLKVKKQIAGRFETITDFKSILVVIDACYSGTAENGINVTTGDSYGAREFLVPCSFDQTTPDQAIIDLANGEMGSPFSLALCNFLEYYRKGFEINAHDIPGKINDDFRKILDENMDREVKHGLVASPVNAPRNFKFYIDKEEAIPTTVIINSIIDHLNFYKEKGFFREEFTSPNNNYLFISSASNCLKMEPIRWKIFSKEFYVSENDNAKIIGCDPVTFRLDMGQVAQKEDLLKKISDNFGIRNTNPEWQEDVFSAIAERVFGALNPDKKKEYPLIVAIIVIEPSKEKISHLSWFLTELIQRVENRMANQAYNPILFNIISLADNVEMGDTALYDEECFNKFNNLWKGAKPVFKTFYEIEKLNNRKIEYWYKNIKKDLNKDILLEYFPEDILNVVCKENEQHEIADFIENLVFAFYKNNEKKRNEIFSTLFYK